MARVHLEVMVPGNGKLYEFTMDDNMTVAELTAQMHAQIEEFEAGNIQFDRQQPLLCAAGNSGPLHPEHTLRQAGVVSGCRLHLL